MLLTEEDLSLLQLFLKNTLEVIEFVKLTSFLAQRLRDSHKIHPNQVCDCVDSLFSVNYIENLLHSLRYIKNTLEILLSSKVADANIDRLWPLIHRRKDLSFELDDIYEAAHRKHHRYHWVRLNIYNKKLSH